MDDREYLSKNPDWHSDDAPYKASWIKAAIERQLTIDKKKVADIGCGTGEVLRYLKNSFPNAYFDGYEVSETAYLIAEQKKDLPHLRFRHTDLLRQDPKQTNYDLILCIDVFEHIPDYFRFLRQLKKYADHFIFHIPLELSAQTVVRSSGLLSYRSQYGHLHFYNRQLALQILTECGYEIVDWQYTPSALVLPGRNLNSRLLKFPRQILKMINQEFCVKLLGGFSLLVYCRNR